MGIRTSIFASLLATPTALYAGCSEQDLQKLQDLSQLEGYKYVNVASAWPQVGAWTQGETDPKVCEAFTYLYDTIHRMMPEHKAKDTGDMMIFLENKVCREEGMSIGSLLGGKYFIEVVNEAYNGIGRFYSDNGVYPNSSEIQERSRHYYEACKASGLVEDFYPDIVDDMFLYD